MSLKEMKVLQNPRKKKSQDGGLSSASEGNVKRTLVGQRLQEKPVTATK